MPILNKDIITSKTQSSFDGLANTANALNLLVSVENSIQLQGNSNTHIQKFTSRTLPDVASSNNQIIYLTDVNTHAIYSENGWYDLNGRFYPLTLNDIYGWGNAACGRLGSGTNTNRSSPVSVVGGFTTWCQLSTGRRQTAAVRTNGTLWAWGCNNYGQLGDGTTVNKSSPVSVVGVFTDWCQASTGEIHTTAVRTNGTLWAWGCGGCGRLGSGNNTDRSSPVSVVGGFTDWCQVSAGVGHTAAVRQNGTLWAWGCGYRGQLGNRCTTDRNSPVSVCGGFTDWCQVSTGDEHTAAVRTNGTLWSWGRSNDGRLGNNSVIDRSSPVSVVGGFTDWCQVSAGGCHTAAVRTNGTLWSWGQGTAGLLGNGTTNGSSSPVSVVGGFIDWCQVSAGAQHTAAVRTNGTLWAWGEGSNGRLGDGTIGNRSSPVSVVGGFTGWFKVSAGFDHTLGINSVGINA